MRATFCPYCENEYHEDGLRFGYAVPSRVPDDAIEAVCARHEAEQAQAEQEEA